MGSISPLTSVFFIVLGVSLVGAILFYFRDRTRFSGYEDLMDTALRLAKAVEGEIIREKGDILIAGEWRHLPVQIRLSHAQDTPGLNIRMGAPATFTLSILPKSARLAEHRVLLRTPDEMFNVRFSTRSDQPTQATLFLSARPVMPSLQKLCRSQECSLTMSVGSIELSELAVPDRRSMRSITEHLETMAVLADELRAMPGAEQVKIENLKKRHGLLVRAVIAVGVLAAIGAVYVAAKNPTGRIALPFEYAERVPEGIWPVDASLIPSVKKWRLAAPGDFDSGAVSWLRGNRMEVTGRIPGDFSGKNNGRDAAYVLVDSTGAWRVVLLSQGLNHLDAKFPAMAVAARVRKNLVSSIAWAGKAPDEPDGDGLLLVRVPNDPNSGLIVFLHENRIVSGVPLNYQSLKLE